MSRRAAAIRKAEIVRTVKGVIATGLSITRIEVEGGKLVITPTMARGIRKAR
jgi:hypothetical protein